MGYTDTQDCRISIRSIGFEMSDRGNCTIVMVSYQVHKPIQKPVGRKANGDTMFATRQSVYYEGEILLPLDEIVDLTIVDIMYTLKEWGEKQIAEMYKIPVSDEVKD